MRVREPYWVGVVRVNPDTDYSLNCADLDKPKHERCFGWIAPRHNRVPTECLCECHDERRMSFAEAYELTVAAIEEFKRRETRNGYTG